MTFQPDRTLTDPLYYQVETSRTANGQRLSSKSRGMRKRTKAPETGDEEDDERAGLRQGSRKFVMPDEHKNVSHHAALLIQARAAVGFDSLRASFPAAPGNADWLDRNIDLAWEAARLDQPEENRPPSPRGDLREDIRTWVR